MDNIEVLERRELRIARKRSFNEELAFLRIHIEPVSSVYADFLTDTRYETVDLLVEVGGVVYDVEVGVSDPGGRCFVVELPG